MGLPLIFLLFSLLVLISLRGITIIHELGHAIPAVLFSKANVTVYIGSYGDEKNAFKFKVGLISFVVKYNPFYWRGGLYSLSNSDLSFNKRIVIILMGPLAPFLCGLIVFSSALYFDWHGAIKLVSIIFLGVATFGLFANLIPSSKVVGAYEGRALYNDGYHFKKVLHLKKLPKAVQQAIVLYEVKKYAEVAAIFETVILKDFREPEFFKMAISSHLMIGNYLSAKNLSDELQSFSEFDADDYANAGLIYASLENYEPAIAFYKRSLEMEPNHRYSLNNFGFALNNIEEYDSAILLLDRAIQLDPLFTYAYNNRGFAKIMLGKHEDGLDDINHSFQLDTDNAYSHRNLGVYYLETKKYQKALDSFEKAKQIDGATLQIDQYIEKAQAGLNI